MLSSSTLILLTIVLCEASLFDRRYLTKSSYLPEEKEFEGKYPNFNILNDETYEPDDESILLTDLKDIEVASRYSNEEIETYSKNKENPLNFTETPPAIQYITSEKNDITIKCIVRQCDSLKIHCNNQGNEHVNNAKIYFRGPSHDRMCISEQKVTRRQVESWFNDFFCYCRAWKNNPDIGEPFSLTTNESFVQIATLQKKFIQNPDSLKTNVGQNIKLECISPRGRPNPQITWIKSNHGILHNLVDARISIRNLPHNQDPLGNELVVNDEVLKYRGSLAFHSTLEISNVQKEDEGHYYCQAFNMEGVVNSTFATLEVIETNTIKAVSHVTNNNESDQMINGTWSQWSIWKPDCLNNDKSVCYQKRKRFCMLPEEAKREANGAGAGSSGELETVSCSDSRMNFEMETRICNMTQENLGQMPIHEVTNRFTLSDCKTSVKKMFVNSSRQFMLQEEMYTDNVKEDVILYLGLTLAVILFLLASVTAIYMLFKSGKCFCFQNSTVIHKSLMDKINAQSSYNPQTAFHNTCKTNTLNASPDGAFIVALRHSSSLSRFDRNHNVKAFYHDSSIVANAGGQKYSSHYYKTEPTDSFLNDSMVKSKNMNLLSSSTSHLYPKEKQYCDPTQESTYLQARPPFTNGIQLPRSHLYERDPESNQLICDSKEGQYQENIEETTTLINETPKGNEQRDEESMRIKAKTINMLSTEQKSQEKPPLPRKEREKRLTINRVHNINSTRPNSVKM